MERRKFLKVMGCSSAVLAGAGSHLLESAFGAEQLVRIRGQVRSEGRALGRVAVTDGLSVVQTDSNGEFEIISSPLSSFVYLSVPAGHSIPTNPQGTARFYEPISFNSSGEMEIVFNLDRLPESDENHHFLLLADPQTEDRQEMALLHEQTVPDIRSLVSGLQGEVFGFGCGDIMFDNLELFPEWERAVSRMGIPFFQVVGNHDLDQDAYGDHYSTETFRHYFGPEYYSFDRGSVHYIVLDDVFWHSGGYIGYVTEQQLSWMASDLALVEKGRTVVVALHIPLLGTRFRRRGEARPSAAGAVLNRQAVYELLAPYNAHVLSGHTHESEHVFEGGAHEHVHGTVCGAWWTGPICYDGTPGGYGTYEVRGEELRWRYRSTGSGPDHQMRLYSRGADPGAADEIIANIWDWDPEWTVVWYEDGERKGPMARRTGFDPLSIKLHRGDELPAKRPWVDPQPTDHLFYAPVSPNSREIRVEATDRFGRTYNEVLG